MFTQIPKKDICLEDENISAGEGSEEERFQVNNCTGLSSLSKSNDNDNNSLNLLIKENQVLISDEEKKDNSLNLYKPYKNYENLYSFQYIYSRLVNLIETKNYEYNKQIEKWFEQTSNKEIFTIEVKF